MTAHPTTFNDTPFRFSHGRSPKGRGSWAFQMRAVDNVSVPDGFRDVVFFNGTFADARRQARDFFPRGASVSVMS
jgi:hypothetical protein